MPQGFSCMKKHGFLTCQPGGSDYGSLKECEEQCSNPVPHPRPKPVPPVSSGYNCVNRWCKPSTSGAGTYNNPSCNNECLH
jgi:hypothetical protein